ncbi:MAG: hypothetical protein GC161_00555 [Planctomycetaceae bacterium]|nr:hypothetical protein [Planctomycetaceae bacterium]
MEQGSDDTADGEAAAEGAAEGAAQRRPTRRRWLGLAAAAVSGFALGQARAVRRNENGTFVWAADRDGGQLYALDSNLLVLRAVAVPAPVRVVAQGDGGALVVSAPAGPRGPHRMHAVSATGVLGPASTFEPVLDLVAAGGERVVLVTAEAGLDAPRRAVVFERGRTLDLAAPPRVAAVAFDGARLALLGEQGALDIVDPGQPDAALFSARPSAGGAAVAADGRGGWWYLGRGPGARLVRLERDLEVESAWDLGDFAPNLLASDPHTGWVWLFEHGSGRLEAWDRRGSRHVAEGLGFAASPTRLVARAGGGMWAPSGGALFALDSLGRPAASQGGFTYLVDASPAEPGRPFLPAR